MTLRLHRFSYRCAEQVLNSELALKQEIESVLEDPRIDVSSPSRPRFNELLEEALVGRGCSSLSGLFLGPY